MPAGRAALPVLFVVLGCSDGTSHVPHPGDSTIGDSSGGSHDASSSSAAATDSGSADATTSSAEDSGADDLPVLDVASADDGPEPGECPCVGTGDGIYLVSDMGQLVTFDPDTLIFEDLGAIECPTDGFPFALAVDRQGHALISYFSETPPFAIETFAIALANPDACEPVVLPLPEGRMLAGTGYASTSAAEPCDDLYLFSTPMIEGATGVIGRIDRDTSEYVEVGAAPYYQAQLSGTGDGRLFGFAGTEGGELGSIASLVRFDIADAAVIDDEALDGLNADNGLGFAFWGGDVYFFTDDAQDTSVVTRLDYDGSDGGGTSVVVDHTPMRIMGAGVSTCAPFVPAG